MRPIKTFIVEPSLPTEISAIKDLAFNLWWTWNHEAIELLRRVDRTLWERTYHNPVYMLGLVDQKRLEKLARDDGFLAHLERIRQTFDHYLTRRNWFQETYRDTTDLRIAYFSAEFGLDECLPIYSGGLGILAGDHLKSSSDLGIPLMGVGLLYQEGYFGQYLNPDGWQQETYPKNDFHNMPIRQELGPDGKPVTISLDFPKGEVKAQVWRARVGRVPLFLLDTNLRDNLPEYRAITSQLYGGDREMRIMQEIVLGVGGLRALEAMNLTPTVCHMNEGHSAFLAWERIRRLMEAGLSFPQAKVLASAGNVFTTHTPVAAGHDYFTPELMNKYFGKYYRKMGLTENQFLALGRVDPSNPREPFCMTILALKTSDYTNAVSKLHGEVSRKMWRNLWPGLPEDEVPIISITNGIHPPSWVSAEMAGLFDRYLGPRWKEDPADQTIWERVNQIPGEELWRSHERRRERLIAYARRKLVQQLKNRGATAAEIEAAEGVLSPEALTIGFARRFATYKRATLLLHDKERLKRILCDRDRPVQIIFAGKAHPHDDAGKELIREIIHFAREEDVRRHMVFLEDYDMCLARYLVQGVDVWLNTPRRLMEASGTSGMKAAINGAINISILDGWWQEAYTPEVGWAIGKGEDYDDFAYQDKVESAAVYDLLEKEVVPLFYNRGPDGMPREWIALMKRTMCGLCPVFNTNRMVHEYLVTCYLPAYERYSRLSGEGMRRAKELEKWEDNIKRNWQGVEILSIDADLDTKVKIRDEVKVTARIRMGGIGPGDVSVEIYQGLVDQEGMIYSAETVKMDYEGLEGKDVHRFSGVIKPNVTGLHGFALRILPENPDLPDRRRLGLVKWS